MKATIKNEPSPYQIELALKLEARYQELLKRKSTPNYQFNLDDELFECEYHEIISFHNIKSK